MFRCLVEPEYYQEVSSDQNICHRNNKQSKKELKQKDMSIISCLKKLSEFSDRILKFLAQKPSYIQVITNFLNKIKGHSM